MGSLVRHKHSRLSLLLLLFLLPTGCSLGLDVADLEDRRCANDTACEERFGPGQRCQGIEGPEGGFCVPEEDFVCSSDEECDDRLFCNGTEVCNPDSDDADERGCVSPGIDLSDGVDCTVDFCDEAQDRIVHDPFAQCECVPGERDPCEALYSGNCVALAACNPDTFTCDIDAATEGTECDDGLDCTVDDQCDAQGQCQGTPQGERCDNGVLCDGREACVPQNPDADRRGCIPGDAAALEAAQGDDNPCTVFVCDESLENGPFRNVPTEACECMTTQDCKTPGFETGCQNVTCDPEAGYICVVNENAPVNLPGAPCDDGVECTLDDACNENGQCAGIPVDELCQEGQSCQPPSDLDDVLGCQPDL